MMIGHLQWKPTLEEVIIHRCSQIFDYLSHRPEWVALAILAALAATWATIYKTRS